MGGPRQALQQQLPVAPPAVFAIQSLPRRAALAAAGQAAVPRRVLPRADDARAEFHALGLTLLGPDRCRSASTRSSRFPSTTRWGASSSPSSSPATTTGRCAVVNGARARARCPLPAAGDYKVDLFAAAEEFGSYPLVGSRSTAPVEAVAVAAHAAQPLGSYFTRVKFRLTESSRPGSALPLSPRHTFQLPVTGSPRKSLKSRPGPRPWSGLNSHSRSSLQTTAWGRWTCPWSSSRRRRRS